MVRKVQKGPFGSLREAVAFADGVQWANDSALCIYDAPYKGGDGDWYVEVHDYDDSEDHEPRL